MRINQIRVCQNIRIGGDKLWIEIAVSKLFLRNFPETVAGMDRIFPDSFCQNQVRLFRKVCCIIYKRILFCGQNFPARQYEAGEKYNAQNGRACFF